MPKLCGRIDSFDGGILIGWALDAENLESSISVEIYRDGRRIKEIKSNEDRPDLYSAFGSNTGFGFSCDLGDQRDSLIDVVFGGTLERIPTAARLHSVNAPILDAFFYESLSSNRFIPAPPKQLVSHITGIVSDDSYLMERMYRQSGFQVAASVINNLIEAGLDVRSRNRIVDIGCGCGRVTSQIFAFSGLSNCFGFDTWKEGIDWAKENLSRPDLSFELLGNETEGYVGTKGFEIPIQSSTADAVISNSLFTHLNVDSATFYLRETSRLLRSRGLSYHSFFFREDGIDEMKRVAQRAGLPLNCTPNISFLKKDEYLDSYFSRSFIFNLYDQNGLDIVSVRSGSWRFPNLPKSYSLQHQDVVVARKR